MKILILAELCNPEWASIPLEAWNNYKALSKTLDCHLVTQIRNRDALIRAGLTENSDFTAIDTEKIAAPAHKLTKLLVGDKGWTISTAITSITYYYFEILVWKKFKSRIISKEFDIVHRLTPTSPTAQSIIAKHCKNTNVPFILGPLNGGIPWPKYFNKERWQEKEWLSYIRGLYKFLPGYKATLINSSAIICGSRYALEEIPKQHQNKCFYIHENGIDDSIFNHKKSRKTELPLKAIFVGRLVPYKGADMAVEACVDLINQNKVNLEIIGDGPQLSELKRLVCNHGLTSKVNFLGWLKHKEIQEKFADSDIFIFPSIREFGGAVVIEAMASGVVPIVVRYGGPSELVDDSSGYFIEINSRENIILDIKKTLLEICENLAEIDRKSKLAYLRAHTIFTWRKKAEEIIKVYKEVISSR